MRERLIEFTNNPQIQAQMGEAFYIWKDDPDIVDKNLEEAIDDLTFSKFYDWFIFDFKLLDDGKRIIELFVESEGAGLPSVEAEILSTWVGSLNSYFEVEAVIPDERSLLIRDLFTGAAIRVSDAATAAQVKPADIIEARPLDTMGTYYFSGVVSIYPQNFKPIILDFFSEEFKRYRQAVSPNATEEDYIKDWGFLVARYLEEIVRDPRYFTEKGEELQFRSADYDILDRNALVERIRAARGVVELPGGTSELMLFSWLGDTEGDETLKGPIIATLEIDERRLSIQSHSKKLHEHARILFEKELDGLIKFKKETARGVNTFVPQAKSKKTGSRRRLPTGVRSKKELDDTLNAYYMEWLDSPHSALAGKTPHECLDSEEGREMLIALLKELKEFYEKARDRGEPYYDVGKLFKELRL